MRTIKEIQDYCMSLPPSTPIALYDEEIKLVHDAYAREQDARRMVDGCVGLLMGHPIYRKTEWLGDSLWPVEYMRGTTTLAEATRPSSEPVRIGDTIKALLKDWKIDPIES